MELAKSVRFAKLKPFCDLTETSVFSTLGATLKLTTAWN